jgi:hypothetical protein
LPVNRLSITYTMWPCAPNEEKRVEGHRSGEVPAAGRRSLRLGKPPVHVGCAREERQLKARAPPGPLAQCDICRLPDRAWRPGRASTISMPTRGLRHAPETQDCISAHLLHKDIHQVAANEPRTASNQNALLQTSM